MGKELIAGRLRYRGSRQANHRHGRRGHVCRHGSFLGVPYVCLSHKGLSLYPVVSDPQHRWLGPEKGVIALATAAIANAVWDMFAKARGKPLWKLIVDFSPEEYVRSPHQ